MAYSSARERQEGLTGRFNFPWVNEAIRQQRARQRQSTQELFNTPGALGRGQGQVPASAVGGGITQGQAQGIYEGIGGELGAAGLSSLNFAREGGLGAVQDWRDNPATKQLYSGITEWMQNPQPWSDDAQQMMETAFREHGQQQLGQQRYEIGRSMAQRGKGDSGTRLKAEQRAASAAERHTLEQIRESKIAREQQALQAKGMAYSAGLGLGGLSRDIAGMVQSIYENTIYDPSGAQEMQLLQELLPEMIDASQVATMQQKQGMEQAAIWELLGGLGGLFVGG